MRDGGGLAKVILHGFAGNRTIAITAFTGYSFRAHDNVSFTAAILTLFRSQEAN